MNRPYLQWTLSLLAGMAVAAAALGASASPEQSPVSPIETATVVQPPLALPAQCDDRKVVLNQEVTRLEQALSVVDLQASIAEQRRLRREGVEQPWPEHPDPLQVPEVLRAAFETALAATETGHLIDMDCEEYPCIVAIGSGRPADLPGGATSATFSPLFDALNDGGYADHEALFYTATSAHGTDTLFLAVTGPNTLDPVRAKFRGQRFEEQILDQIADELDAGGAP